MSEEQHGYSFSFFHVTVTVCVLFVAFIKSEKYLKKSIIKTETDLLTNKEKVDDWNKLKSYFVL